MHAWSISKPLALASVVAAILAASLLAFVVFSAKDAGAQSTSIKVEPSEVDLDLVGVIDDEDPLLEAELYTEGLEITLKNNGDSDVTIGGIDLKSEGLVGLDLDDIKLVDPETGQEFLVDTTTGLLQLLDENGDLDLDPITGLPILGTIDVPGNTQKVLEILLSLDDEGPINAVIEILDDDPLTNTVIQTVLVTAEGRQCTIVGTEGDDQGVTAVRDTAAGTEDQPEVVCGLGGNDEILATAGGNDITVGGPGNDTINMKDGVRREYASGGSGKDLCKPKDKKDKVKSCGTKRKGK